MHDDSREQIIPEVGVATSVCPNPSLWHCYDSMATEVEVLEFLTVLVIMLKPSLIVETGCYRGHATERLLQGVLFNGFGRIITCDTDSFCQSATLSRIGIHRDKVSCYQSTGIGIITNIAEPIDFAFLDSGSDAVRIEELSSLYPKLSPGAVVAIHDTGIHTFLREKYLGPFLRGAQMQYIYFDTPRGLALCRKKPEIYP